jgi:SAM-dependent methyltransferase
MTVYQGNLEHSTRPPSTWVASFLPDVMVGQVKTLLDVACGNGRHIALARARGYSVTGLDRDISQVTGFFQAGSKDSDPPPTFVPVALCQVDLETTAPWPIAGKRFDVVIVTNYLHRPRLPDIIAHVADDGMLIYETFATGQQRFGRPSNPDFLVQPGELLRVVQPNLTPFFYEHGQLSQPDRVVQHVVAVGQKHPWQDTPPPFINTVAMRTPT